MKGEAIYIGIDVAKDRLDVAVRPTGKGWSVSYEDREVEKLVLDCRDWSRSQW